VKSLKAALRSPCPAPVVKPVSPATLGLPFSPAALSGLIVRCSADHRQTSCLDGFLALRSLFRVLSARVPSKIAEFSTFRVHVFDVFISDWRFCNFVYMTVARRGTTGRPLDPSEIAKSRHQLTTGGDFARREVCSEWVVLDWIFIGTGTGR
jgi:hypothetical protein